VRRINPDRVLTDAEKAARWRAAHPEKAAETYRKFRQKNSEKRAQQALEWRATNRERVREYNQRPEVRDAINAGRRARYAANPAVECERAKGWRSRNKDKVRVFKYQTRARKYGAPGSHTAAEEKALLEQQHHACANPYCRADLRIMRRHLDHIVPLVAGGSNDIGNCQWLCGPCNSRKNILPLGSWLQREALRCI